MRKLLVSLCALGSFSMAFAIPVSPLPNGSYSGWLQQDGSSVQDKATAILSMILLKYVFPS